MVSSTNQLLMHSKVAEYVASFMRIGFLNGEYVPLVEARIPIFDRGFMFGESVYEVIPVYDGVAHFFEEHIARLESGLQQLSVKRPSLQWNEIFRNLVEANRQGDCQLYIQVTGGVDRLRSHRPILSEMEPTTVAFLQPVRFEERDSKSSGIRAFAQPDDRHAFCHIKTTNLLSNIGAKIRAVPGSEIIYLSEGFVAEGASSNVFAVREGRVYTPSLSNRVLPGVTRKALIGYCRSLKIEIVEGDVSLQDLYQSDEVWVTSSIREITPVTQIDGLPIGDGVSGPIWRSVYDEYLKHRPEPSLDYPTGGQG